MSTSRRRLLLAGFALGVMLVSALARQERPVSLATFRVVLGLGDKQPADWSGQVMVEGGEATALSGWRFAPGDAVKGTVAWKCRTQNEIAPLERYPVQNSQGKPKGKAKLAPMPNGIHITVKGEAPVLTLKLLKGTVTFAARDIRLGEPKYFLDAAVQVQRLPDTVLVREAAPPDSADPVQDDYPAFWVHYKTNKHFLAWVAYQKEKDRVLLAERDGPEGAWSKPLEVAGPGQHFRVALATIHHGTLWIVWSSQKHTGNDRITGNWELFGRTYKGGKLGDIVRLTDRPRPDIWQQMTTDNKGRAWLVWQGIDFGQAHIFARCVDADGWHEPIKVSTGKGNDWAPAIAADSKEDRVWIGWDTYDGDNYGVRIRSLSGGPKGKLGPELIPDKSGRFGANLSLACDRAGRLWAAWAESGPQWGKDTGFLYGGGERKDTSRLYAGRDIRVVSFVDGVWYDKGGDIRRPQELGEYNDLPQLQADGEGRMWLAFRHRTCLMPREDGWAARGRWDVYATAYLGGARWLIPFELPASAGRIDMRISSQRDRKGQVYFAYASDNRRLPGMAPRNHHVAVSKLGNAPAFGADNALVEWVNEPIKVKKVHPREKEQVARIRAYKAEVGGKTYRIYRGDLHRHTDISSDGPGDGSLMDLHRYARDAAALDFVLVADHNMGHDNEYCWWRTQQANDLYTVPGAFFSMYGYERSVRYPNGHRNVIWPERGHRTLPLPKPLLAAMKADTPRLYDYLRRTGGICTAHTSASDQGTNWEDAHDPTLEPFVEIFQGYHTSYEAPGAPKAINDKTDRIHGPYKGDGFVSMALEKGYRLGFQSSSDHISTHVSYACIYSEDFSRKGLVEAMRRRHSYAATDNIILDVRLGSHLMGEEVRTKEPRFDVIVLGTGPIDKVEILRNNAVMHTLEPKGDEARFTWQDRAPLQGEKASFYYVRVLQKDGNMAWGSPIWVTGN
jgi:hypothetical protein